MTERSPAPPSDGGMTIGLDAALAAARTIAKVNRLAKHLRGLDAMAAARKGVRPGELEAILSLRLTQIEPGRLDHLLETLLGERG